MTAASPEYLFTYIDTMLPILPEAACTVQCSHHYTLVMLYLLLRHIVLLGLRYTSHTFLGIHSAAYYAASVPLVVL